MVRLLISEKRSAVDTVPCVEILYIWLDVAVENLRLEYCIISATNCYKIIRSIIDLKNEESKENTFSQATLVLLYKLIIMLYLRGQVKL